VVAGTLHDPYTGQTIQFNKTDAAAVQIDHMVPRRARVASAPTRGHRPPARAYANDERVVLLAVSGPANEAKADNGPADCDATGQQLPADIRGAVRAVLSLPTCP